MAETACARNKDHGSRYDLRDVHSVVSETISRAASRSFSTPVRTAATQLTSKTTGGQFKIRFNLRPVLDDRIKSWTAFCRADSIESRIRSWGCRKSTVKKTSPGMTLLSPPADRFDGVTEPDPIDVERGVNFLAAENAGIHTGTKHWRRKP
jgi:hypothetical protein